MSHRVHALNCCVAAVILALGVACKEKPEDSAACDDAAVASLQLSITDTSASVLPDATATWSSGGDGGECESIDGSATLVCGFDVTGDMEITAAAPGHVTQTATFNVKSDGCHAITANEVIRMSPE